jgi:DNA-binding NarL/FixJ family response regulator
MATDSGKGRVIRVYIVEDHAILREALNNLLALAGDITVIGMAACAEDALVELANTDPDVLLVDIKLAAMDGVELIRQLRTQGRLPPALILTTFEDDAMLLDGLRAGAKGYLLKDVSLERLLAAIHEVASGGTYINPAITERILRVAMTGAESAPVHLDPCSKLTDRERQILRLMANGYSNKEIALALGVSEGTVKNHVSNILSKLSVRDRTRAVLKGIQSGLL